MTEITDEQARFKVSELILAGQTLESAEGLSDERRNRAKEILRHTIGELRDPTPEQQAELLSVLKARFATKPKHYKRSKGINFYEVQVALEKNQDLFYSLFQMEQTGGEPDIIAIDDDAFVFADCSAETPNGRRHLTYNEAAEMAEVFGIDLMSQKAYRAMQKSGKFDMDTWSWLATPNNIRKSGYALRGYRYDDVVGVDRDNARRHSLFGSWRGMLRVPRV